MWKPGCYLLGLVITLGAHLAPAKEFLTPQEIENIQEAQDIDARVKVYLAAAALRLKTATDRLAGIESTPGDPLEFFSVEDMLDGYYQILRSVMLNLDDASAKPSTDPKKVQAALKNLKSATEAAVRQLDALKRIAEEQRREEVWKLVGKAIEINNGAHEGAVAALAK
jgi:hypothetical protein